MSRKTNKKMNPLVKKETKLNISEILVANEKDLRPYIEILNFTPENVIHSQMGSLLGVFEIKDDHEDSAYIVNFLSSVAKKEYFSNPKRPAEVNFESALNKINLALSEIAKHGNIEWLGKIDIAICAIEKNNIYFSVTGNARIILAREQTLMDITQGLSPKGEPYPLRTFSDTASGKLKNGDKMIITTGDIFKILSLPEIEKRAFSFTQENFAQFLKTALINELEIAGALIMDVSEISAPRPEIISEEKDPEEKLLENFNAFSEKTFKENAISLSDNRSGQSEKKLKENSFWEKPETKKEYIDKKTGHIYVQGETRPTESGEDLIARFSWLFIAKEKISDWLSHLINEIKIKFSEKVSLLISSLKNFKDFSGEKITRAKDNVLIKLKNKIGQETEEIPVHKPLHLKINGDFWKKFLPDIVRIKEIFLKMDYNHKIYAFLILAAILIFPLVAMKIKNKSGSSPSGDTPVIQENFSGNENLTQEKNIKFVEISMIHSQPDLLGQVFINEKLFAIGKREVIEIINGQKREFGLAPEMGNITSFTLMKDLNLIFFLSDNQKILSFSPLSKKFREDNIQLPENSNISALAVYLTYIYLADSESGQIYRYPRAEGGFGEKTAWLRENIDMKNVSDMAIDGDIYLVNGDSLLKFSSGKKQDFNLEESSTPINFNKIFTNDETEFIYVLDKINGRVIKFSQEGKIITQYGHEKIKEAKSFFVDEKSSRIYTATTNSELISFSL